MAKCISCGTPTSTPGICTDCLTAKWYTTVLYYSFIVFIFIWVITALVRTVDNVATLKTVKEFGAGQYFRNIVHIHDDNWIGEIGKNSNLYAFNDAKTPTDSLLLEAGSRYEHWGYRKFNDSITLVCLKIYKNVSETENLYLRVPERWGWFKMQFAPKSEFLKHNVSGYIKKEIIDDFYNDPRIAEMVVQAEGRREIKRYKADKAYRKMKAERSFDLLQKILVPIMETIFIPSKLRKDFILKEDYRKLKEIKKEYFDETLMIEKYVALP